MRGPRIIGVCPDIADNTRYKLTNTNFRGLGVSLELFLTAAGNVVLPPSIHPDSTPGNLIVYTWLQCGALWEIPYALLPELFDLGAVRGERNNGATKGTDRPQAETYTSGKAQEDWTWLRRLRGNIHTLRAAELCTELLVYGEFRDNENPNYPGWSMFSIRCPWHAEHTGEGADWSPSDTSTVIFEKQPDSFPVFKCLHAHCAERGLREFLEWAEGQSVGIVDRHCTEPHAPRDAALWTEWRKASCPDVRFDAWHQKRREARAVADDDNDQDEDTLPPFPIDCLPTVLRDMSEAVAASALVPIDLSAPAVLGPTSAAAGKGIQVKSGADIYIRGNLYFLSFAESGVGKSLALKLTGAPLMVLQKERRNYWKKVVYPKLSSELRILNKEIARLEQQIAKGATDNPTNRQRLKEELQEKIAKVSETADQLYEPKLIVEDETEEHLALMLQQNREQLFSMSVDAGKVIQNLVGRYSKDKSPDDTILVKSFSGDPHSVGRMNREREPIDLHDPCMSLLWYTQPEKAVRLLENTSLSDGGFLPRCLMSDTKAEPTERDHDGVPIPTEVRQRFNDLIVDLHQTYWQTDEVLTIPASVT
jgi:uncharacterized protein DUF3987